MIYHIIIMYLGAAGRPLLFRRGLPPAVSRESSGPIYGGAGGRRDQNVVVTGIGFV